MAMIDENSSLKEYFEAEIVSFKFKPRKRTEDEDSETEDSELSADKVDDKGLVDVERPFVWCGQVEKFLGLLMSERGYNPNELDVKIGIDFGQESLKVTEYQTQKKVLICIIFRLFYPSSTWVKLWRLKRRVLNMRM